MDGSKSGTDIAGGDHTAKTPNMHESWLNLLAEELRKEYMVGLREFLRRELQQKVIIYPPMEEVFAAFRLTAFEDVKVVILGQDPYHGKGQAHGLCFSVKDGVFPPPSLQNIFKELNQDLSLQISAMKGNLTSWTQQGVFLLNTVLTVRAGEAASHRNRGWELFTDKVLRLLNARRERLVFILWGRFAHEKRRFLDGERHLILQAAHPSPYSAAHGFFGCRHFSQTNAYLRQHRQPEIDWRL